MGHNGSAIAFGLFGSTLGIVSGISAIKNHDKLEHPQRELILGVSAVIVFTIADIYFAYQTIKIFKN